MDIDWIDFGEPSDKERECMKDWNFGIDKGKGHDVGMRMAGRIIESHIDENGNRIIDKVDITSMSVVPQRRCNGS